MEEFKVKDIMVPLAEYATCSSDATLNEAVMALEKAQQEFHEERYRHRAILVYSKEKKIVGKVSQMDVLRALEPRYKDLGESSMTRFGFSKTFLKSMMEHFRLWEKPLEEICRKAAGLKVKDVMYTPGEGEYVQEDASINEAIHQLVMGHHQSLLVTEAESGEIVGILRLTDVFMVAWQAMRACKI
jgi:CBS domain-containing protein